jgi:hypothetical protein
MLLSYLVRVLGFSIVNQQHVSSTAASSSNFRTNQPVRWFVCDCVKELHGPRQPTARQVAVGAIELRIVCACTAAVRGTALLLEMCSVVLVATHVI